MKNKVKTIFDLSITFVDSVLDWPYNRHTAQSENY